ncbi:DUF3800 domain-containing protein [Bacillus pumilus]|uniref:DUF3800 domain-containing protein n=1 Tax=Bacillus pumilus TaxID=1408 RepID=UPI003315E449
MIEIYCDESRPDALSRQNKDQYMIIGGVLIDKEKRNNFKRKVKRLQSEHEVFGEIKWRNVSPSKINFYLELVDLFFSESIRFKCIVVDTNKVKVDVYHNNDNELGFYKFYYQLLVTWFEQTQHYWIYLDHKKNKEVDRLQILNSVLNNASFSYIEKVQAIESRHSLMVQLADVLIGAVGYKYHNYNTSSAKLEVIERIEQHLEHPIRKTFKSAHKFNVFEIRL